MPTYEYTCKSCGEHTEAVQTFTDDALTVCPNCGGTLRKVFGNIGISFKGSGFYKNDSRSSPGAGKTTAAESSDGGSSNNGASKSDSATGGGSGSGEKSTSGDSSSSSSNGSNSSTPKPGSGSAPKSPAKP
ncbi:MAG: FmdB family transcriptional regulator [Actinomycetota bacterium]|nr:FmdB family transcriptional regulator [Actinomycetota bacterium]